MLPAMRRNETKMQKETEMKDGESPSRVQADCGTAPPTVWWPRPFSNSISQ